MAISTRFQDYLEEENIPYQHLEHDTAYTAPEIAASQHVPGKNMLKGVLVKGKSKRGSKYVLCVLSAEQLINFDKKFEKLTGLKNLQLASEEEMMECFPNDELGAEPPFGNLYNLDTYADESIQNNEWVALNAGTHEDVVMLRTNDYVDHVKPIWGKFGQHI